MHPRPCNVWHTKSESYVRIFASLLCVKIINTNAFYWITLNYFTVPVMMDVCLDYLEKRRVADKSFTYEVIVVDDGSRDKTTEVALGYSRTYGSDKVRVLTLAKNRGKGGAVRMVRGTKLYHDICWWKSSPSTYIYLHTVLYNALHSCLFYLHSLLTLSIPQVSVTWDFGFTTCFLPKLL